jgi:hypothetical protein
LRPECVIKAVKDGKELFACPGHREMIFVIQQLISFY